ncbi:MAG: tetratricopeptide repeat protein [Verrucomicrobiota bacterium]|jgi:tetratricopeptide (TPR) repeat protein
MERPLDFRFELPRPPSGPLVEMSSQEMEKLLLKRLEQAEAAVEPVQALWQLAQFYKQIRRTDKAMLRFHQLIPMLRDLEDKAKCLLSMGQTMEQAEDVAAAAGLYKEALALEPMHTWTWYFINNNLAYCLNTMSRFGEGEVYCRKAIEADPNRPNAYKNLGAALAGQGQYREAAHCFVAATQVNAADGRAFRLLRDLLSEHPELEYEFEGAAASCQKAVETAARKVAEMKPVIHRGWKKRLILLRAKVRTLWRQLWSGSE